MSVLHLPDDSMKGRIIGREGRNIRTFEAVTGVNLLIDDTPEAVLLSSFDPVRREIARITLEALVADGRIQPQPHRGGVRAQPARGRRALPARRRGRPRRRRHRRHAPRSRRAARPAALPHLVRAERARPPGRGARTSPGSWPPSCGLPVEHAKRCALLHDIGKALTHEVEGSHALIGAEVARRYGEHEDVVHAIEAHHNEVEVRTLEAVLTQTADAHERRPPGRAPRVARALRRAARAARADRLVVRRRREGVRDAGRSRGARVVVLPDAVDDIGMQVLARDIAAEIEHELTYPGPDPRHRRARVARHRARPLSVLAPPVQDVTHPRSTVTVVGASQCWGARAAVDAGRGRVGPLLPPTSASTRRIHQWALRTPVAVDVSRWLSTIGDTATARSRWSSP